MNRVCLLLLITTSIAFAESNRIFITAGPVVVGCSAGDQHCDADEGPAGGIEVNVPPFWIDAQETSVAEYRACVTAGVCTRPFDFRRVHYCNFDAPQRDHYPVLCRLDPSTKVLCVAGWAVGVRG